MVSRPRVILSSQRLWPISWSYWVAFIIFLLDTKVWPAWPAALRASRNSAAVGPSSGCLLETGVMPIVRDISRHTEEHQCFRTRRGHQAPRLLTAAAVAKNTRPVRPKPLIAILADTFVSPADSRLDRKPDQFPNTRTSKCSVLAQRARRNLSLADSVFGSSRNRQYLFFRLQKITNRASRLDGVACTLTPASSHTTVLESFL